MKNVESLKDTYRYLMGGYYGIREMDEYNLKEYVLKDIQDYIDNYFNENPIPDFNYEEEAHRVEDKLPLITKLQDSLLVLPKVDAPMELVFLVKEKIKKCKDDK